MLASFALLFATAIVVEGRNDTIVDGWVAEPAARGTWSLLWSCLSTIFVCTWSVLHLNVPKRHGTCYLFFRKLGYMFLAAMAPEYILFEASKIFFEARSILNRLSEKYKDNGGTITHMKFACAHGFWTRTFSQRKEEPCPQDRLEKLIMSGDITGPSLSEKELTSRGKTDGVLKFVAVLQITWFGLQILFRAIQHYRITALEIMATAFVFCSLFIYGFCWYQPQNIEYPVYLEIPDEEIPELGTAKENTEEQQVCVRHTDSEMRRRACIEAAGKEVRGWVEDNVPETLLLLFACGFGAMHCLAWNSPFPTPAKKLAWRICSVATTALPAFLGAFLYLIPKRLLDLTTKPVLLLFVFYLIERIVTMVLAFMALRALPADTYRTVDWNIYLPHFTG